MLGAIKAALYSYLFAALIRCQVKNPGRCLSTQCHSPHSRLCCAQRPARLA